MAFVDVKGHFPACRIMMRFSVSLPGGVLSISWFVITEFPIFVSTVDFFDIVKPKDNVIHVYCE